MKIEKHNIIQCVGIVLLALILIIMCYTIKSKQEQIKALESSNTDLQTYCSELEMGGETLLYESKEEEVFRFQDMISQLKETDKRAWFILYKSMQEGVKMKKPTLKEKIVYALTSLLFSISLWTLISSRGIW